MNATIKRVKIFSDLNDFINKLHSIIKYSGASLVSTSNLICMGIPIMEENNHRNSHHGWSNIGNSHHGKKTILLYWELPLWMKRQWWEFPSWRKQYWEFPSWRKQYWELPSWSKDNIENSHHEWKMIIRLSFLHDGNSHIDQPLCPIKLPGASFRDYLNQHWVEGMDD